jgi:hypothetical protein
MATLTIAGPALGQAQSSGSQPAASQQDTNSSPDPAARPKAAAKKVYTNDDLKSGDAGDVSVVGNDKRAVRPGQTAANQTKNEQYWHNRAEQLRRQMAELDRQIAQIEAANQKENSQSASSGGTNPPPAPLSAYTVGSHVRGGNTTQLDRLKNRKAQLQEQMDQLEEEARKANVPPGWLR